MYSFRVGHYRTCYLNVFKEEVKTEFDVQCGKSVISGKQKPVHECKMCRDLNFSFLRRFGNTEERVRLS